MEDLTEVITASEFHPHHCNLFVYSSSKGSLRLCDMRASALCDKHSKRKSWLHWAPNVLKSYCSQPEGRWVHTPGLVSHLLAHYKRKQEKEFFITCASINYELGNSCVCDWLPLQFLLQGSVKDTELS